MKPGSESFRAFSCLAAVTVLTALVLVGVLVLVAVLVLGVLVIHEVFLLYDCPWGRGLIVARRQQNMRQNY